jgi:hypothetical protein
MKLQSLAHSRTGDKGDTSNISIIAYRPEDYLRLCEQLTAERVAAFFAGLLEPGAAPVRLWIAQRPRIEFRAAGDLARRRDPFAGAGRPWQMPGLRITGHGNPPYVGAS